jgi:TolB-like protein
VGFAYLITAWLVAQIADLVLENFGAPVWFIKSLLLLLGIGFPIALIFAWVYELTPDGIKRDHEVDRTQSITASTGKRLNFVIIGLMVLAIAYLLFERQPQTSPPPDSAIAQPQGSDEASANSEAAQASVAVLPFVSMSSGQDDEYFADGLTEEILNSLTALPELLVTARTSSFYFKGKDIPIPEIAQTLGVAHVVEGSVRRANDKVRITAQLIRASDGFHIWSASYDRTLEDVFAVQEDIATNIAMSLDVVLDESKKERMRNAGIKDVETFILYQKGKTAFDQAHRQAIPTEYLREANRYFNAAIARSRTTADVYLLSTDLYGHILFDYTTGRDRTVTREQAQDALTALRQKLAMAIEAAGNPKQRSMAQAEAVLFSDNWSNMAHSLKGAMGGDGCLENNWASQNATPFGYAEALIEHDTNMIRCDPMNEGARFSLPYSQLWAGHLDEALAAAETGLDKIGFHPWIDDARFLSLLAMGRFKDDPGSAGANPRGSFSLIPREIMVLAANGDIEQARESDREWAETLDIDDLSRLLVAAMLGDREQANELAKTMDARLAGPFSLTIAVFQCLCGAPFDIDSTPSFKARIEEAGFPWPPPTRIHYPAKNW